MSDAAVNSYDEVPYDSHAFIQTHPDTLATVATLFGMSPPPVAGCRVLELGCASGGNIIPMAATLPGSRFVGIDRSSRQVAEGRAVIEALGLTNIELRPMSILEVDESFGEFDYIICHGVYSWVPAEVREKILEVSSRHLAPQGVAYVSYNCYPGWHVPGMIREMMVYHSQHFPDSTRRVKEARAILDYLAQSPSDPNSTYARLLRQEADMLRSQGDYYLYHDHLEVVNHPVYFHEFAGRAAAHGLQYIWEAYQGDRAGYLRNEVRQTLDRLSSDLVHREQYLDFLLNRRFRMSLLCHEGIALDRAIPAERMASFHFIGAAKPRSAQPDIGSSTPETFAGAGGESVTSDKPLLKATLLCLSEATPRALAFDELCAAVGARLDAAKASETLTDQTIRRGVSELLRQCVFPRLVELHVHPPWIAQTFGERPVASPVARFQSKTSDRVTNLRHQTINLGAIPRFILRHLDGQHDQPALLKLLVDKAASGGLKLEKDGQPVVGAARIREVLSSELDFGLRRLAEVGLLLK